MALSPTQLVAIAIPIFAIAIVIGAVWILIRKMGTDKVWAFAVVPPEVHIELVEPVDGKIIWEKPNCQQHEIPIEGGFTLTNRVDNRTVVPFDARTGEPFRLPEKGNAGVLYLDGRTHALHLEHQVKRALGHQDPSKWGKPSPWLWFGAAIALGAFTLWMLSKALTAGA